MVLPTKRHIEWADCELGAIIHLDLQSFVPYDFRADFHYHPPLSVFDPAELDTDQWVSSAAAMGAKYIVLVAKHCSGFSLWPTAVHDFSVRNTPFRGGAADIVGDFIRSCRRYGIRPGLYYSASCNAYFGIDNPGTPTKYACVTQEEYNRIVLRQLTELWSQYGELFEIWFDGGCLPVEKGGPDIASLLHRLQPDAVVFQGPRGTKTPVRWVGNEGGRAPDDCFATIGDSVCQFDGTREERICGNPYGDAWQPAESDMPNRYARKSWGGGWFWHPGQKDAVIPAEELLECYYTSVGRNTNQLIGMVIDNRGLFPRRDAEEFCRFGNMVRQLFAAPIAETRGEGMTLTLTLPAPSRVRDLVLCEDIRLGECVTEYHIDAEIGGQWIEAAAAHCIGHKRIHRLHRDGVTRLRLRCTQAKAAPQIKTFAAY